MTNTPEDIPLKISTEVVIGGRHPLVFIGANGSGKTRLAAAMSGLNDADMIGALRNIALSENIPMLGSTSAHEELQRHLNRRRSRYWELSSEIDQLFGKLLAEDSDSAITFRNLTRSGKEVAPEETKVTRLSEMWERLFPGRNIDFLGYSPKVHSNLSGSSLEYPAQQMSDGERVAIYLAGRVLDSESQIIIVDEPEVHFHSRLAARFWSELEGLRPDCRFVYITHDLSFALSRQGAQYVIVRPGSDPEVVELQAGIPDEIAQSLLAAASFSVHANRIVFCEGTEGSLDQKLYSAWFNDLSTAVVPVGSCRDVVRCAETFASSTLVQGLKAIGIIDRDYWPEIYLNSLSDSIHIIQVHEIENLMCLESIFLAMAEHLSIETSQSQIKYNEFIGQAKSMFNNGLLNHQISQRFRRRCEHEFDTVIASLKAGDDLSTIKSNHVSAIEPGNWVLDPEKLFDTEQQTVQQALSGNAEEFLKVLPAKVFFNRACDALGVSKQVYTDVVCSALKAGQDSNLVSLKNNIVSCLSGYLPPRNHETVGWS